MPTSKDLFRFLKAKGFVEKRQRGSHLTMKHPDTGFISVIPIHSGELPRGLFLSILKDAGYSYEDYLKS
jgi:predicted RNA binding protein YcfA (HicA-like mRNA interferase family)